MNNFIPIYEKIAVKLVSVPTAAIRPQKHWLDFTNARFHGWALRVSMNQKRSAFSKWCVNQWYEIFTRFFKA